MRKSKRLNIIDKDHPGFKDSSYVRRRNQIAEVARNYTLGEVVPEIDYIDEEHRVWASVYTKLEALYRKFACKEYQTSFLSFDLPKSRIAQFKEVNEKLHAHRFSISPVEGLVTPREFLMGLAQDTMLCTQYIRHHSVPDYTPEPDVIHETFGHAVFFLNEDMRDINSLFGKVAQTIP